MEQAILDPEERRWRRGHAIAVLILICFYLVCPVAPHRWSAFYDSYGKIFIIATAAIYFYRRRFRGCLEVRLVVYYAVWVLATRFLNGDHYLENQLDLVISRVLCAVVLPVGLLLEPEDRARLLNWLSALLGGFYFVVALLGLYAYFTGRYFYIPPEDVVFGIDSIAYFNHLVLLQTNRTISAIWLYLAWCLMAYQFFNCPGRLWRVPIALAWAVFHIAIATAMDRTVKLAVSANLAMLFILWAIPCLKIKKQALKLLVISLVVAASIPLLYKSFDLIIEGLGRLSHIMGTDVDRPSEQFMDYFMGGDSFTDPRELSDSMSSDSARAQIYRSFIPTLREEPLRILIGKSDGEIMSVAHKYMEYPFLHMHNFLLQTFLLTGLPGFLLVLAFSVLLIRRTVLLFFSRQPRATLAVKSLCLPISGLFVYGMIDCFMFTSSWDARSRTTDVRELCFFLLAGIVLAYSYELSPQKKTGPDNSEQQNGNKKERVKNGTTQTQDRPPV